MDIRLKHVEVELLYVILSYVFHNDVHCAMCMLIVPACNSPADFYGKWAILKFVKTYSQNHV